MQNTGDTSKFRQMSHGCDGCDAVADRVDSIYEAGGNVHTNGWTRLDVIQSSQDGKKLTLDLKVDSAPTTYVPSKGAAPRHLDGGHEHFQVQLKPITHSWRVTQFVQVDS
jgi:hypothetical protein